MAPALTAESTSPKTENFKKLRDAAITDPRQTAWPQNGDGTMIGPLLSDNGLKAHSMLVDKYTCVDVGINGSDEPKLNGHAKRTLDERLNDLESVLNADKVASVQTRLDMSDVTRSATDMGANRGNDMTMTSNMEVDQLLSTLQANDMPNVEELMQVLKTIDNAEPMPATNQTDTDLLSQITNAQSHNEPILFQNISPEFCRNLLSDDVDLKLDEVAQMSSSTQSIEPNVEDTQEKHIQQTLTTLKQEEVRLERRFDFLLRRLTKLQTRGLGVHVSGEICGLFEHAYQSTKSKDKITPRNSMSLTSMRNFISHVEKCNSINAKSPQKSHKPSGYEYFGAKRSRLCDDDATVKIVPDLSVERRAEVEKVAGLLDAEVRISRQEVDSDATASSSGAESADEMQTFNNPQQSHCSISKRAAWKWAQSRSAIASRWTWLQWQINDLEHRITQLGELQKRIRKVKGAALLDDDDEHNNTPVNGYRSAQNGAFDATSARTAASACSLSEPSDCNAFTCARTRPLKRKSMRNRRLLQTTALHAVSKKWKPTSLKCACAQLCDVPPCALCTGKYDPSDPRETRDLSSVEYKLAYLDAGYHEKISFKQDVNETLHYDAILKLPEWQTKSVKLSTSRGMAQTVRKQPYYDKTLYDSELKETGEILSVDDSPYVPGRSDKRKYSRHLKPPKELSALLPPTSRSKNHRNRKIKRGGRVNKLYRPKSGGDGMKPKRHLDVAFAQLRALATAHPGSDSDVVSQDDNEVTSHSHGPATDGFDTTGLINENRQDLSPQPSGSSSSSHQHSFNRRSISYSQQRSADSYDIDNIVIPYSVASSARLEKLPYKEILTPKWRVLQVEPITSANVDDELEDITEDVISKRHALCELEERRKFMSYIKLPQNPRARANLPLLAHKSGANTPDHSTSPHHEPADAGVASPRLVSPPLTPMQSSLDLDQYLVNTSIGALRRRSLGQNSRWYREHEVQKHTDDVADEPLVSPYEPRKYPLTDDDYVKMCEQMPRDHCHATNVNVMSRDSTFLSVDDDNMDTETDDDDTVFGGHDADDADDDLKDPDFEPRSESFFEVKGRGKR